MSYTDRGFVNIYVILLISLVDQGFMTLQPLRTVKKRELDVLYSRQFTTKKTRGLGRGSKKLKKFFSRNPLSSFILLRLFVTIILSFSG